MTLRRCLGCGTHYAVGLNACPQCASHAGESVEEGEAPSPKPSPRATKATKATKSTK